MKICVNYGHAFEGKGTGAVGLINESKETRNVGKRVVDKLKANSSHTIIVADYNGSDNYVKATNYANSQNADLFISIHFNSGSKDPNGNGKSSGTETLVYSANQDNTIAKRINANIVKLGFRDRRKNEGGILVENDLYVLKNTKMKACLVECCFVDDKDDINLYNPETMANAIVEGILGKSIGPIVETKPQVFKIVTGGFGPKENAEAKAEYLRNLTGWYLEVKIIGSNGDYCIHTGGFTGEDKVKKKLNALQELTSWWATYQLE